MLRLNLLKILFFISINFSAIAQTEDSVTIRKIYNYFLEDSKCYTNLNYLCKKIGNRLSGSEACNKAVDWAYKLMQQYHPDTVYLQPVKVPVWKRGQADCTMFTKTNKKELAVISLGGSVSTPHPIKAKVIEVTNEKQLELLGEKNIKGKIVFFNVKFNPKNISTLQSYGETVMNRYYGASMSAKYGAVAFLIRSMTLCNNNSPHAGGMKYNMQISDKKIPAMALSYQAADTLSYYLKNDNNIELEIFNEMTFLDSAVSYNVIAEIKGSKYPNEYITIGGHLDSWDVGEGAHDDGAGIVQCIDAINIFKTYKPLHTIRIAAFMNEENGLMGGKTYANIALQKKERHIAALETDLGGFTPRFITVDSILYNNCKNWNHLFNPYLITILPGGDGSDIYLLKETLGTPLIGYIPDGQRYFDIHHTKDDVFESVNKRELELGGAAISSFIYMLDKYYQQ